MRKYDPSIPLISIHVPKCGGTSFSEILKKWFGKRFYGHYYDEKSGLMPKKNNPSAGTCIHGHFNRRRNFGIPAYYPEADQFITFLRDPFEIVVSRYFFEKKKQAARNQSFRGEKRLRLPDDIEQYLDYEIRKSDYHPNILDYMPVNMDFDNFREVIDKHFIYIGVLKNFQFSVDKMAEKLNFPTFQIEHLNKSDQRNEFSSIYRKRFVESHPLEYAIYNYVLGNYREE